MAKQYPLASLAAPIAGQSYHPTLGTVKTKRKNSVNNSNVNATKSYVSNSNSNVNERKSYVSNKPNWRNNAVSNKPK